MSERLSFQDASSFIVARYGERASTPELIGAGEWSQAYAFSLEGRELVIRFGLHRDDFAKDALVGDLAPSGIPVPKVIDLGDAPAGYFAVAERRHGMFLDALDGAEMRATLPSVFGVLDALRNVDVSRTSGYGTWRPTGDAPYGSWAQALPAINEDRLRIGDWRAALQRSPVGIESFNMGFQELEQLSRRLPNERQMVHDDLLNRNVVVEDNKITAVIDWGNALYGDALYDAAWLIYWWPWFPAWSDIDVEAELMSHWQSAGSLPEDVETRLLAYQIHIGLDHLAYTAAKGRWDDLARNDTQVRQLCRRAR
jgi:hygromycin-B 4-O-kinase